MLGSFLQFLVSTTTDIIHYKLSILVMPVDVIPIFMPTFNSLIYNSIIYLNRSFPTE